jgi:N-acetylmuramate 1-kinase
VERYNLLESWLQRQLPDRPFALSPASSDASFRRYFRLAFADGSPSLIAMDAPPPQEDCRPFVTIAQLLADAGIHVPKVIAQDLAQGFLLLSDLGNTTYLTQLLTKPAEADAVYQHAIETLVRMQAGTQASALPDYDRSLLARELALFPDWYVTRHHGYTLTDTDQQTLHKTFDQLLANNLAQPRVAVHRDFHSRNLMLSQPDPGVLDFQDAVNGPITYDLVSLLRDAYIEWPEERVLDWTIRYWEAARKAGLPVNPAFGEFYRDFEWMGLQRHLKVLGIFARLNHRDGKDGYLKDLPLVSRYVRSVCERYTTFTPLLRLLDRVERRAVQQVGLTF